MTNEEKMEQLEELFEVEHGKINESTGLDTLAWDSMAMLSVIAIVNEHFGKKLSGAQLKGFKTVGDILNVMA